MESNREKIQVLLMGVLLLTQDEFRDDLSRVDVDTWDSLAMVMIVVGIEDTFGVRLTPEDVESIDGVQAVLAILRERGVDGV